MNTSTNGSNNDSSTPGIINNNDTNYSHETQRTNNRTK